MNIEVHLFTFIVCYSKCFLAVPQSIRDLGSDQEWSLCPLPWACRALPLRVPVASPFQGGPWKLTSFPLSFKIAFACRASSCVIGVSFPSKLPFLPLILLGYRVLTFNLTYRTVFSLLMARQLDEQRSIGWFVLLTQEV